MFHPSRLYDLDLLPPCPPAFVPFASKHPHWGLSSRPALGLQEPQCLQAQSQKNPGIYVYPPIVRWVGHIYRLPGVSEQEYGSQDPCNKSGQTLRCHLYSKVPLWDQAEATLHGLCLRSPPCFAFLLPYPASSSHLPVLPGSISLIDFLVPNSHFIVCF